MARILLAGKIEAQITLEMTEDEAGALDALVGYGFESFKKVFYEKLGAAYMEPHEAGLRSLFESVRCGTGSVSGFMKRAQDARDVFHGRKKAEEACKNK